MSEKFTWPCPGNPEALKGQAIGMYHCEFCGEMQIAGLKHLPPQFPSQWEGDFPKIDEPPQPPLIEVLELLNSAALARDSAEVCCYVEDVMRYSAEEQAGVWEALHAHRADAEAAFIIEHLEMVRGEDGRWSVRLKEG